MYLMVLMKNRTNIDHRTFRFNSVDMLIIFILAVNENKAKMSEICRELGIANNNLSKHIKTLEDMNILQKKPSIKGKTRYLSLNISNQKQLCLIRGIVEYFAFDMVKGVEESATKLNNEFITELGLK